MLDWSVVAASSAPCAVTILDHATAPFSQTGQRALAQKVARYYGFRTPGDDATQVEDYVRESRIHPLSLVGLVADPSYSSSVAAPPSLCSATGLTPFACTDAMIQYLLDNGFLSRQAPRWLLANGSSGLYWTHSTEPNRVEVLGMRYLTGPLLAASEQELTEYFRRALSSSAPDGMPVDRFWIEEIVTRPSGARAVLFRAMVRVPKHLQLDPF